MKFQIFLSNGQWYWRLRARNGRIIADGAEGYKTRAGIKRAVWRLNELFIYAGRQIEVEELS